MLHENVAFERAFVAVQVPELTIGQTIEILKGLRDRYEKHHRVSITDGALVTVSEAAGQRLPGERLPGKAVDLRWSGSGGPATWTSSRRSTRS